MQSTKRVTRFEWLTKLIDVPVLMGIALVSILIRGISANWPLAINGFDSWYLFYNALLIAHAGGNWYAVPPDVHAWFPWGYFVELGDTIGLPFIISLISLPFMGAFGANAVYTVTIFSDIALAGIGVVAAFLAIESITESRLAGYASAIVVAVSPALTYKNVLGGLPKDSWGAVLILFTIYLFNQAIKKEKALYGIPAGVLLFLAEIVWGGNTYIDLSLIIAAFLVILLNRNSELVAKTYGLMAITTGFLTSFAPNEIGFLSGFAHGLSMIFIGIVLYADLYLKNHLPKELTDSKNILISAAVIFVFVIGISSIVLLKPSLSTTIIPSRYYAIINPFFQITVPIDKTVAEYIPQSITSMIEDFGISLFLSIVGIYYAIKKGNLSGIWLLVLGVAAIFGTSEQPYLFNYTAYLVAALAGIGIYYIVSSLRQSSRLAPILVLSLFAISLVADAGMAAIGSNAPQAIDNSATGFLTTNYAWVNAIDWLRDCTPPHTFIMSWWDYGYWLETLTNKTVIDENNTLNGTQIKLMAKMFLNNESYAAYVLEHYYHVYPYGNPNYTIPAFIVTYDAVTEQTSANGQITWYLGYPSGFGPFFGYTTSLGDIAKAMGAMTIIAGYNESAYTNTTELISLINSTEATYGSSDPTLASNLISQIENAQPFAWTPKAYNSLIVQMFIEGTESLGGETIAPFTTTVTPTSNGFSVSGQPLPPVHLNYFQPAYISLYPVGSGGVANDGGTYTVYIMVLVYQFVQPGYVIPEHVSENI
ncbi:STT3 domain-containing protein [Sulfuracidifex tepidarius]|uniref:dolichyl-phosphooligosaccharide-protein glycotransferase n=1 Tax=Sulfuracidifex tepidarius TaxID=1294262 RepID=A0A510DTS4_9CREN|nr:STT3 domain-containing protein [Sulfuracidifex tepidarius]BBG23565.1 hypothetical protein IC006_0852 [Sulfuracidifex tepidarius]BBG26312.1 hypothetical protein IC007_0819 [Sulfuracidifex tepidarius]